MSEILPVDIECVGNLNRKSPVFKRRVLNHPPSSPKLMDRLRGQARGVDLGKLLHDQRWLIKAQGRFQSYVEVGMMKWRADAGGSW